MYPYQYTWFNSFGNIIDINKNFEIDYWGVSGRNIAKKINNNDELLLNNVFFDTCVYHQPGIDLLAKVIPIKNILFASEMVGAVRGIDPESGFNYDDTKRYIDSSQEISDQGKDQIFSENVYLVFPRLKKVMKG